MFLEMLSKEQKNLFMHLAVNAAKVNNSVENSEREMLVRFAQEMKVEPITDTDIMTDDIINALVGICGNLEKKIILFEIIGILLVDCEFDEKEKKFLYTIAERFGIPTKTVDGMILLVNDYVLVYKRIFNMVILDMPIGNHVFIEDLLSRRELPAHAIRTKPYGIIHERKRIKIGENTGWLVWDYVMTHNELTFEKEENGEKWDYVMRNVLTFEKDENGERFSLFVNLNDLEAHETFDELVKKCGI